MAAPRILNPNYYNQTTNNDSFLYFGKEHKCNTDNAVDPDVAGIGVMVSFLVSAGLTFLCILIGWFQNAIPGLVDHPVDLVVKGALCRGILRRNYKNTPASKKAQQTFEAIILAFSDQQLVIGFAILVSAYFKADITVYSFQVVSSLAWFSSTIHLATLVVLKQYLKQNKIVRYFRVTIMLAVAGLLLASQIQGSSVYGVPSWLAMQCVTDDKKTYDILTVTFVSVWLVFAFVNRIMSVCILKDQAPMKSWLFEKIMNRLQPLSPGSLRPNNLDMLKASSRKHLNGILKIYFPLAIVKFSLKEFMNSFVWEIVWLMFSSTYGITGTVVAWRSCSQPHGELESCWEKVLDMGFGQMVPLVLLLLPFFALLESYGGVRLQPTEPDNENDANHHTTEHATDSDNENVLTAPSQSKEAEWIASGGNPYETKSIHSTVYIIVAYAISLLTAAGVFSALNGGIVFLIVTALVLFTYIIGTSDEIELILKALGKKQS